MAQQSTGTLSIIQGNYKFIAPSGAPRYNSFTNTELGNDTLPQLYNIREDPAEKINVAEKETGMTRTLLLLLDRIKNMVRPVDTP